MFDFGFQGFLSRSLLRHSGRIGVAVLTLLPFLGCGDWPSELKYAALRAELEANRANWAAAGIRSYEYHYNRVCFCPPASGLVRVSDGQVVSARLDSGGELASTEAVDFPTIDELFDGIQEAIDANYASIEVEFDPVLGYPTRISIVTSFWITDSGFTQTAEAVTPAVPD